MKYLNDQIKNLYGITDADYANWCKKNSRPLTYKSSVEAFVYRLRTGRLIKDNAGMLKVKKPRKQRPVR